MADTDRLLTLLEGYCDAIESHSQALREELEAISGRYLGLRETYAGTAAEQFKDGWERAQTRFAQYQDDTAGILVLLKDRLANLRDHAREDLGL